MSSNSAMRSASADGSFISFSRRFSNFPAENRERSRAIERAPATISRLSRAERSDGTSCRLAPALKTASETAGKSADILRDKSTAGSSQNDM